MALTLARAAVVVAIAACWTGVAQASDKTDVVALANGDHFTGEIVRLSRGRLELKTDDAGTIEIEWEKIVTVEAARRFDIATSDGRRFLGSLRRALDQSVVIVGSDSVVQLLMSEVTDIAPIGASFWAKLEGSVDAGFTYTRSSGVAQASLNSNTAFRRPAFLLDLAASATVTERSDGAGRDDRAAVVFSYVRYRGLRWFVSGQGGLETNESLGLLLRSQIGGLVGLRLVNSNRAQVEAGGGLVVNDERAVDAPETQNVEGLFGMKTSFYTYDRPKTNFDASVQYYPSLNTWGRQRLQVDSSIKRELWRDFFCSFDVYDTFDSAPPNPGASRNDIGVVIGVGWSY